MKVKGGSGKCGCREKKGHEVFSSGLNVSSGQGPMLSPRGANVSHLVCQVRYPLVTLLVRWDTCRDLGEQLESDRYTGFYK